MPSIPKLLPIQSPLRNLRVEQSKDMSHWMIWLAANKDFTRGTYFGMHNNGKITRTTIHPDGTVTELDVL